MTRSYSGSARGRLLPIRPAHHETRKCHEDQLRESETIQRKATLPARAVLEYDEPGDRYITFLEVIQSNGQAYYMYGRFLGRAASDPCEKGSQGSFGGNSQLPVAIE